MAVPSEPFDPEQLRRQCQVVAESLQELELDTAAAVEFGGKIGAAGLSLLPGPPPGWLALDESGSPPSDEAIQVRILMWNAVNFSYFPDSPAGARWWWGGPPGGEPVGQDDEATGVLAALTAARFDSADRLSKLTAPELTQALAPPANAGPLPMLDERLHCLRELGQGLVAVGGVSTLVESAQGSAVTFVQKLVKLAPQFGDFRTPPAGLLVNDEQIQFAKRAQLCAAMLAASGTVTWLDLDYRLPQLLQAESVFRLGPTAKAAIECGELVPANSRLEVELRAATVAAGELIRTAAAAAAGRVITAAELDYYLWRSCVDRAAAAGTDFPQFHRTRTTSY